MASTDRLGHIVSHVFARHRSRASTLSRSRCADLRHQSRKYVNTELPFNSRHHPGAFVETFLALTYTAFVEPRCATTSGRLGASSGRTRASCA